MSNNVPITDGSGTSSIAAQDIGGVKYQQIEVVGNGGASVLNVNSDGSLNVRGQSSVATVIIGGSIAASFTPPANQSVSGTIGASIIGAPPANLFVGGALVTTANPVPITPPASGTLPVLVPGSVITVGQGSIGAVIIGGSVAVSTGNSSVQVLNFPSNQSVSGTVGASIIGIPPVKISDGSSVVPIITGQDNVSDQSEFPVMSFGMVFNGSNWDRLRGNSSVGARVNTANYSVITTAQGSVATVIVGGSVAVATGNSSVQVLNFPANQSVSGTVQTDVRGSVATVIIGGSIATATTNSSVMLLGGTNNIGTAIVHGQSAPTTSIIGNPVYIGGKDLNGSTIGAKLTASNELIITGSVQGFPSNQSVSGAVNVGGAFTAADGASPNAWQFGVGTQGYATALPFVFNGTNYDRLRGNSSVGAFVHVGAGSVITVGQGSVAVNIIAGSIAATFTPPANQSVSGTVQTDVRGSVATVIIGGSIATATTNSSVMLLNGSGLIGSVIALQGGTNISSISGTVTISEGADTPAPTASILVGVTANTNGSVATVTGYQMAAMQITSGPGASITAALNFEGTIDGTQFYPIQGYNVVTGQVSSIATVEGNWQFNVAGLQGLRARVSNWSVGSITARVVASPEDARTLGTYVQQTGVNTTSIVGGASVFQAGPWSTSMIGGASVFQAGTWAVSVMTMQITSIATAGQVMGSVATLQGTNPWNIAGSVAAFAVGNASTITIQQANSIVGTYSVAATYAATQKAIATMGIRNDTLASIASGDLGYTMATIGPAGEAIVVDAPYTKWVQGTADLRTNSGTSVAVIAAQGASIFTYIREIQVANMGSASVLVTFSGATSSIIGYTIAPAGGGSNYITRMKTNANGAFTASISGVASVLVTATGFISKT